MNVNYSLRTATTRDQQQFDWRAAANSWQVLLEDRPLNWSIKKVAQNYILRFDADRRGVTCCASLDWSRINHSERGASRSDQILCISRKFLAITQTFELLVNSPPDLSANHKNFRPIKGRMADNRSKVKKVVHQDEGRLRTTKWELKWQKNRVFKTVNLKLTTHLFARCCCRSWSFISFIAWFSFFIFIRLFWNQILICLSVSVRWCDISIRRRRVKYLLMRNSFSNSSVCHRLYVCRPRRLTWPPKWYTPGPVGKAFGFIQG